MDAPTHNWKKDLIHTGQGPDGKLMVRLREQSDSWVLEHVLVTLQQQAELEFNVQE
ncbi:hypothetical protein N9H39_01405 [Gammaproteobacteria bacterium]|nr:hypothetical protein [Gammaproteobacteria bacterium]